MNKKLDAYSDDEFIYLVKSTTSLSKVAAIIGCKKYLVDDRAKQLNVYYKNQGLKGSHKNISVKYDLDDILAGKYPAYSDYKLKLRLIDAGILDDKCSKCGYDIHADGNKYSICELHHIDGDNHNHKLENLELLCPNCHALTSNYKFRKRSRNDNIKNNKIKKDTIKTLTKKQQSVMLSLECKNKKQQEIKDICQKLLDSNIDFSKFGWVGKASKIIGITPQKVNQWMKRNMLEFYNDKCFKRNMRV